MISIIIPLYNKEQQIAHTLHTVFAQTYTDYEIVIVDDGSKDRSAEIVASMNDHRIRLIHQENAGVSAARNRGIAEARGEFIALLDADDEWKTDYLETQMQLVADYPQCDVYATNYEFRNAQGKAASTIIRRLPFTHATGILSNYFEVASVSHPPLWTSAVMVRKSALESVGGFPIGIKSGEDLLTWARLYIKYKIAYSVKPLAIYNLGEGYDYSKLPPRKQDTGDPVGVELNNIYQTYRGTMNCVGLKQYLSHWHKMRASVAIRFGDIHECVRETTKSIWYNPLNYKVYAFIILAVMPSSLRKKIISLK